jgi:hypothetical protein
MEDELLLRYQPKVREAFAEALEKKLDRQAKRQSTIRRATLGLVLSLSLVAGTLGASPQIRAEVLHFIREIGTMVFIECGTAASCIQAQATLQDENDPSHATPTAELSHYSLSLSEVRAIYPEIDDFLPRSVPEGFTVLEDTLHLSLTDEHANPGVIWSAASTITDASTAPWISLSIWLEEQPLLAKAGTLREIMVDGHRAAIAELHAGTEDNPLYGLNWRQNGLHYSLAWPLNRVGLEDALQMAESVPEKQDISLTPEELRDLALLFLPELQ